MKTYFLLFSALFYLPLFAQESESSDFENDFSMEETSNEEPITQETSDEESVTEEVVEEESEFLEEPPEISEPEEPVLVKVEIPRQIEIDDNQTGAFKLLTPWAPKPKQQAPIGWRYVPASAQSAYPVTVNLSTGKPLTLKVIPYKLVPEDEKDVIQALEPGYNHSQGYEQTDSISAKLSHTTSNLKDAASSLDQSIQNLSALVDSLPK